MTDILVLGEEVEFEILDDGLPRWDMSTPREKSRETRKRFDPPRYVTGKIWNADLSTKEFSVTFKKGELKYSWNWPFPGTPLWDDTREGWLRKRTPVKDKILSTPTKPIPIWTETLTGYSNLYSGVPSVLIQELEDRAECGIRRKYREWPFGNSLIKEITKTEVGNQITFTYNWYWLTPLSSSHT